MQEIIHILAATNKKYAPFCGIMPTSVLMNNPKADAYLLIRDSLGKQHEQKFKELEAKFDTRIHFIRVESDVFSHVRKKQADATTKLENLRQRLAGLK